MTFGYNVEVSDKETIAEDYNFDRYFYPEFYNCYNASEISNYGQHHIYKTTSDYYHVELKDTSITEKPIQPLDGPMDSAWPMYCHDTRHTGRSPYSTVDTWDEIWRFKQDANDFVRGSPVVGDDGIVYFGGMDFYALYPNGTLKWKYDDLSTYVWSAPAIDENGTIYFGDHGYNNYLYALYPNGTLKWKFKPGDDILSSPAIAEDGTIYFGCENHNIYALYPNGTLKWKYTTGHIVYSSPAIGEDGTVYCGSHDTYLYAFYPNNGTLKWKYKTGHWVRVSPCIADDGTVYFVSLDNHLYAVNPNGSLKWKTNMGQAGTSPTIGQDGTIYCGYTRLHAVNPMNGSIKWMFDVDGAIRGSTPCNSIDGTIYFGTSGCWFYAVNPDGTLKWRKQIATVDVDSAPAIGEDGTIYVGSSCWEEIYPGAYINTGYLHAFGIGELEADANGPYYGLIDEPVQFEGQAIGGYSPYTWHWDFGDTHTSEGQNPLHTYTSPGNYTVTLTVTDNTSNTSSDTTWAWIQMSNTPPNKPTISGETHGDAGTSYEYTFTAVDPDESIIWYYIDWGDNTNTGWLGPYSSGQQLTLSHSWSNKGTYNISAKAKDPYNAEGPWGYLEVEMPVNYQNQQSSQQSKSLLFLQLLERLMLNL